MNENADTRIYRNLNLIGLVPFSFTHIFLAYLIGP